MQSLVSLSQAFDQAAPINGTAGKVKVHLLFNRANGVYWGFSQMEEEDHAFDLDYFIVEDKEMDVVYDAVIGTYPDYQIVPKADVPQEITEDMLNAMTADQINARFPVAQQLNVISAVLLKLSQKAGMEDDEDVMALQDMVDEISDIRRNNKLRKQGYAGNDAFQYISTEDRARRENSKFEGGLHERMGPRTVVS